MLIGDLLEVLERRAPAALAEEWDNVGLMLGRRGATVSRLLVALEVRPAVLREARDAGCQAILVHHPPIFPSVSALTDDEPASRTLLEAAERGVAIVAAHTNLDAAPGGLNDLMAAMLGLRDTEPLRPADHDASAGLGRIGTATGSVGDLVAALGAAGVPGPVTHTGERSRPVHRVACCTGSGAALIPGALAAGADAYVTGDLKYHDADRAGKMALVGVPHAGLEREAMRRWVTGMAGELARDGLEVRFADTDTDPWSGVPPAR
jgi:dinuclear metal center YbgI/SA1388 family protein